MSGDAPLPGWYGKLPSLGDFATRRLPPLFVDPWDRWLATGMAAWRDADSDWLDAFLAAPTWRFALGAGIPFAASPGYAGILMPSVDRVGRYFPLTIARPRGPRETAVPAAWLEAVEDVAIAALDEDWSAERLDDALAGISASGGTERSWPESGTTLWWCERRGEGSRQATTQGLPGDETLTRLLAGRL